MECITTLFSPANEQFTYCIDNINLKWKKNGYCCLSMRSIWPMNALLEMKKIVLQNGKNWFRCKWSFFSFFCFCFSVFILHWLDSFTHFTITASFLWIWIFLCRRMTATAFAVLQAADFNVYIHSYKVFFPNICWWHFFFLLDFPSVCHFFSNF